MTQSLRDFIAAREGEIKAEIKALNAELRELRAAKSAIDRPDSQPLDSSASGRKTHRDLIVSVLDDHEEGGTSDKVIEWVNDKFGVEISQASISSQLSRAKKDGVVTLETGTKIWRSVRTSGAHESQAENPVSAEAGEAKAEDADDIFGFQNPNHGSSQ